MHSITHVDHGNNKSRTLSSLMSAWGFDASDFDIQEDTASDVFQLFGWGNGLVMVRCHSTGEERLYATEPGLDWLSVFLQDLNSGCFAGARKTRRERLAEA
jgi:hypothetical protein